MSPRETIETLGGMSADAIEKEIENRILRLRVEQAEAAGVQMGTLIDRVDAKFDEYEAKQDLKLENIGSQLTELSSVVTKSIAQVLHHQEMQDAKFDARAAADDEYREGIRDWRATQEPVIVNLKVCLDDVVNDIKHIRQRMKILGWLMLASHAVTRTFRGIVVASEAGKKMWAIVAGVSSSMLLLWQFFHAMLPALEAHFRHH